MNLEYTQSFKLKPCNFEERVAAALQTPESNDRHTEQYKNVISLIDDTLLLVKNYRDSKGIK